MNFILIFFLIIFAKTENFQMRQIYYDAQDNICVNQGFDQVQINFTFETSNLQFPLVQGGTYCETWTWSIVDKIKNFEFFEVRFDDGKFVQFGVELQKISVFG